MRRYHDDEWGVPSHDERHLFEMLILEGAQAGLSWSTILNKRENYRRAFDGFDPRRVARYGDDKIAAPARDPGIVRNRLKVRGAVTNARAVSGHRGRTRLVRLLPVGMGRRTAGGQPAPIDGRPSGPVRAVGPPVQGSQTAWAHLRRVDHRLLLPPGGGRRRRPPGHLPEQALEQTGADEARPVRCEDLLAGAERGVLATLHARRGVDAVPVCFAVATGTLVVPIDQVKPKGSTDLQRRRNLAATRVPPCSATTGTPLDWTRLWWVRASLTRRDAGTDGERSTLASLLRRKYPPYQGAVFADLIVFRMEEMAGWSARPDGGASGPDA